ncbi:HlyD family secretion protein [Rhizobium sp. Root1220]|uniref:HlyD family secretion protein n=1 Tax=Rhizobium sp. Root1220 TaxID=1736432 RepID=UPI0006F2297B|nr:HlyD family secretion protein [Rhizobium sp. Root1220]KQV70221.1 hemolysin D [Rhizobium sp. Root1220]
MIKVAESANLETNARTEQPIPTHLPAPPASGVPAGNSGPSSGPLKRLIIPVTATVLAVGLGIGAIVNWSQWEVNSAVQTTDDAYVAADVSTLSSRISGNIKTLGVSDYQSVKAGQLIVEIDPDLYDAAVRLATANVDAAKASFANLSNQEDLQSAVINAAIAQRDSAVAQEVQTGEEAVRQVALGDATTKQNLQAAQAAHLQAQAAVEATTANIEQQKAQLKVLKGQEASLQAQVDAAGANLSTALLQQKYSRIYAPYDGVVGLNLTHVGDYVGVGTSVISIVPLSSLYIAANFKETQLARMKPGSVAEITIDTYPGQKVTGKIVGLSPASGAVFALLPPDNATGNFTKVVQRVPIKIEFDPGQPLVPKLRAGLSVLVRVNTPDGSNSAETP